MAKILDFNKLKRPTLPLVMPDEQRTQISVTTPTEALVEEFLSVGSELEETIKGGDGESIRESYELAAKLISCNTQGLQVTAEDLRDRYKLDLVKLVYFFSAYADFINEISNAKN